MREARGHAAAGGIWLGPGRWSIRPTQRQTEEFSGMKYSLALCAALLLTGLGGLAAPSISFAHDQTTPDEADKPEGRAASQNRQRGRQRGGSGAQILAQASGLKAAGQCREAIAIYVCFADRGRGYEIAQLSLAECLAEEATRTTETGSADAMRRQALFWAGRAAGFGDPSAQGFLAYHYLAGDLAAADTAVGGKWYYVFQSNPRHVNLGLGRLPDGTDALAENLLDENGVQSARAAATAWRPVYTAPPAPRGMMPAEGCILSKGKAEGRDSAAGDARNGGESGRKRGEGKGKGRRDGGRRRR